MELTCSTRTALRVHVNPIKLWVAQCNQILCVFLFLLYSQVETTREKYFSCQPNDVSVVTDRPRARTVCVCLKKVLFSRTWMYSLDFCTAKCEIHRHRAHERSNVRQLARVLFKYVRESLTSVTAEQEALHCRPEYEHIRFRWYAFSLTSAGNSFCVE